ncbi:MAG: hypothetical protein AMXMBFR13_17050 [Phycisphaerae bacterium]
MAMPGFKRNAEREHRNAMEFLALRVVCCLCALALAGCSATGQRADMDWRPYSVLFLDVAATPEWKATHQVVASWSGRTVTLPAWIAFRSMPNAITFGGYALNGETRVEFGAMRIAVTVRPECWLTFADEHGPASLSRENEDALEKAGIRYWAIAPSNDADEDPGWIYPGPDELRTRVATGQVQTVVLDSPNG